MAGCHVDVESCRMSEAQVRGVVEVPYQGGLGSRLSQYCVGRILATELGFDSGGRGIPGFVRSP